jgi:hypothetical protein
MPSEVLAEFQNERGQSVVDVVLKDKKEVYLTIDGETAFQTGYDVCDTCSYVFRKVVPAQRLTDGATGELARQLSIALKDVRHMPDAAMLADLGTIFAPGTYSVALVRLTPELTMPGDPKDYFAKEAIATWGLDPYFGVPVSPRTPYYRLGTTPLGDVSYGGNLLGVALGVPLYPPTQKVMNRKEVIGKYRSILRDRSENPTAFALGLVEDRGPAVWDEPAPEYSRHLIVTLYILDGHHKVSAAAAEHVPLQFLVFFPHSHLGRDWRSGVDAGLAFLGAISA